MLKKLLYSGLLLFPGFIYAQEGGNKLVADRAATTFIGGYTAATVSALLSGKDMDATLEGSANSRTITRRLQEQPDANAERSLPAKPDADKAEQQVYPVSHKDR